MGMPYVVTDHGQHNTRLTSENVNAFFFCDLLLKASHFSEHVRALLSEKSATWDLRAAVFTKKESYSVNRVRKMDGPDDESLLKKDSTFPELRHCLPAFSFPV